MESAISLCVAVYSKSQSSVSKNRGKKQSPSTIFAAGACLQTPSIYTIDFIFTGLGDVVVSSVQFQLTSALNAITPTFTLTCTSTGGPATTVSWTVNNHTLAEDSAHHITSQITDAETATYTHTLTVTERLVGEYECSVSNDKPSSSSGLLAVVGKNYAGCWSAPGSTSIYLPILYYSLLRVLLNYFAHQSIQMPY